jgi:hypothetical protein
MPPPLSLSDDQMALVTRAAALLPRHDRDRFLQSIAGRLGDHPTDGDILGAIDFVLAPRGIIIGGTALKGGFSNADVAAAHRRAERLFQAFTKELQHEQKEQNQG